MFSAKSLRLSTISKISKRNLFLLASIVFIFVAIPITVYLTQNSREPTSKAASAIRGVSGDLWADIVIGQRDFTEINPNEIVADKAFNPGGIVVDNAASGSGKAFVWDGNNNRILGFDLATCYAKQGQGSRCAAQIVIGQPSSSDHGACNLDSSAQTTTRVPASSATLCGVNDTAFTLEEQRSMTYMAVDSAHNLYVADLVNNRVLRYIDPFTSDSIADEVWGQADFTGNLANRGGSISASTLSFNFDYWGSGGTERHGGVAFDPLGNLWIADTANSRVLRFPKTSGQIAKTADIVLGQANFTTANTGSGLNQLKRPASITFDTSGNLYVADSGNNRVLVFSSGSLVPGSNAISATGTFGSDFAHTQPFAPANTCVAGAGYTKAYDGCDGNPWAVQLDPLNRGIWTSEVIGFTSRMRLWGFNQAILKSFINTDARTGGSLGIDKVGNVMMTGVSPNNEVFRYLEQTPGTFTQVQKFFSPPVGINLVTNRRLTLAPIGGMTVVGDQLVVSDKRLLFWTGLSSLTNGKAASGYLRTSSTDNITDFTVYANPNFSAVSGAANKLWATTRDKILIYQAPLTSGAVPIKTITSVNVLGGGSISFTGSTQLIAGLVASADGNYLWVSQSGTHRAFRIRNPLSTSPVVDIILGQTSLSPNYCNRNQNDPANTDSYATPDPAFVQLNTLCYPGALGMDRQGNLYVSDVWHEIAGNQRLLMFTAATFPSAPTTLVVTPSATKEFPRSQHFGTWQPTFDSTNRMVVGYNPYSKGGNRVDYFNNPTGSSTTPDGQLNDFDAWPIATAFDSQDNLYIYESNRSQVRVYKQPFNTSPAYKPGDYDHDGSVGIGDLNVLVNTWKSTTDLRADANNDKVIDLNDLSVLVNNWGS